MKYLIAILLLTITCIYSPKLNAQVSFNFNPLFGQSIEGLSTVQIMNSYNQDLSCKVTITIRKQYEIVQIVTPVFILRPGMNMVDKVAFSKAQFLFGENTEAFTLRHTGKLLEGEYEYCFEADISESKIQSLPPIYENCFVHIIQPLTPLLLIDPADGDKVCNKRPNFLWQPPIPMPVNALFRIMVTKVNEGQDIAEAIAFNLPYIKVENIVANNLFYPANLPDLIEGGRYAWQVIIYSQQTIIKKSEIWEFTVSCDEKNPVVESDSFRQLKETLDGSIYYAYGKLKFAFYNPYGSGKLAYTISSLTEQKKEIKNLPELEIKPGENYLEIDLWEYNVFKLNHEYVIKIRLANNRIMQLRFIYKEK